MYIESIEIENYKSFHRSGTLTFGPGFNVVVGANNAGKTALLECLTTKITNQPHRSLETVPHPGYQPVQQSSYKIIFNLQPKEALQTLSDSVDPFFVRTIRGSNHNQDVEKAMTALTSASRFIYELSAQKSEAYLETVGNMATNDQLTFIFDRQTRTLREETGSHTSPQPYSNRILFNILNRIYKFDSQRVTTGKSPFGLNEILTSNADNLPGVLNYLQTNNQNRYDRLNAYVRAIFPDISHITVPAASTQPQAGQVEIKVWPAYLAHSERQDLAMSLADCGTGISQVLAMLYVVITAEQPHVILIDEPQSFLHPGAVRKLLNILADYPQHQFIITTHSPDVITATTPSTITLLQKQAATTIATTIDPSKNAELKNVLAEVGARLSDVFGADTILWVEGATEENCFPAIMKAKFAHLSTDLKVLGITQTSDIEGRDAERLLKMYVKLSTGPNLLPPAIAFILDKETRSESQRRDLKRTAAKAGTMMLFLPRRMYENYLLDADAIASVANSIPDFRERKLTNTEVQQWLDQAMAQSKYYPGLIYKDLTPADQLRDIHGAKVLEDLFAHFSETRVDYQKTEYGPRLTQYLLDHDPDTFEEITSLLREAIPNLQPRQDTSANDPALGAAPL